LDLTEKMRLMERFIPKRKSSSNTSAALSNPGSTLPPLDQMMPKSEAGIYAYPLQQILNHHQDILARIKDLIFGPKEEAEELFKAYYLPAIQTYAAYVHLLPASENHHHNNIGGLLCHGLEAGHRALNKVVLYGRNPALNILTGQEARDAIPCFELAIFLAGLTHDAGKIITDMRIYSSNEGLEWNPYAQSLVDWMASNRISKYYVQFRPEREHKEHQQFSSSLMLDTLLDKKAKAYLHAGYERIMPMMHQALMGLGNEYANPIQKHMQYGDEASVATNLKKFGHSQSAATHARVPVCQHVLDAARRLVASRQWCVNTPGHPVWIMDNAVYICWQAGSRDIISLLAQDNIEGIPRNPQTLADILIDHGIAIAAHEDLPGKQFWYIAPDAVQQGDKKVTLQAMRIHESYGLLNPLPDSVPGSVYKDYQDSILETGPAEELAEVELILPEQFIAPSTQTAQSQTQQKVSATVSHTEKVAVEQFIQALQIDHPPFRTIRVNGKLYTPRRSAEEMFRVQNISATRLLQLIQQHQLLEIITHDGRKYIGAPR
jgi:conjugal transfer pilus assembly protein TraI